MWRLLAALGPILALLTSAASAADVTLRYRDGGAALCGEYLDFDGETYRLDTVFGVLTVNADRVTCEGEGCPDTSAYRPLLAISGSRSGRSLVLAVLDGFAASRGLRLELSYVDGADEALTLSDGEGPVADLRLRLSDASEGFADLLANQADAVLSLRAPLPDEAARLVEAGLGDLSDPARRVPLAHEGLVPAVAAELPLAAIDPAALGPLLAGGVGPLNGQPFIARLGPGAAEMAGALTRLSLPVPEGLATAEGRLANGVLSLGLHSGGAGNRLLALRGSCGAVLAADAWTLATEDYPLSAPLSLYLPRGRQSKVLRDVVSYLKTPEAAEVVATAGFVPVRPALRPLAEQGARLARALRLAEDDAALSTLRRLAQQLDGAARLSVTFRFEEGSADLDAPSMANLDLLARFLSEGGAQGREIVFAGFSDGIGAFSANLDLSRTRAEAVRDAVADRMGMAADALRLTTRGYGEAMPMACDEDPWGRNVNRRVEVWLR